jgi:hypothetical protein
MSLAVCHELVQHGAAQAAAEEGVGLGVVPQRLESAEDRLVGREWRAPN